MKFWAVLDSQGCREENPTFGEFSDLIERIILCVVVADRNIVLGAFLMSSVIMRYLRRSQGMCYSHLGNGLGP